MREDYTMGLLNYLTGNLEPTSPGTEPFILETNTENADLLTQLSTKYGNYNIDGSIKCTNGNGEENGKILFYGYYYGDNYGYFMVLTDENLQVIKIMDTFSSGTPLFQILALEVDENGYFYGIDYDEEYGYFRIILLNNISEKVKEFDDYVVVLRNSYRVQGYTEDDDVSPYQPAYIKKSKQSATYYFALSDSINAITYPSTFTIQVGSTNEWKRLPEIVWGYDVRHIFQNIYFNAQDQPVAEYHLIEELPSGIDYAKVECNGESDPTLTTIVNNIDHYIASGTQDSQISYYGAMADNGDVYMVLSSTYSMNGTTYTPKVIGLCIKGTDVETLFEKTGDAENIDNLHFPYVQMFTKDSNLFVYYLWQKDFTQADALDELWLVVVPEKRDITINQSTHVNIEYNAVKGASVLTKKFNLYYFNFIYYELGNGYNVKTTLLYNNNNYNSYDYIAKDMFVPKQCILGNQDYNVIMARNLYNYKTYSNTTKSTLNVPNNMLNNETISFINLLSKTTWNLGFLETDITKNVYEDLYINLFNSIKMVNRDTNVEINNKEGAIRLNDSVSKTNDYEKAKATKVRKNYSDGTSDITSISTYTLQYENDVWTATYRMVFQNPLDKDVHSIDILSEDEKTLYTTIPFYIPGESLPLTPGGVYQVEQKVHVE